MWAVVPVKDMSGAKQRLAPVLASDERQEFYRAMLEDVVSAVAQVSELTGICLVTRDQNAIELGRRYGIRIIGESENRGHSAAVTRAAKLLVAEGASGMLQIPGDVPLVRADEIRTVLQSHRNAPAVTLVPSHDARGSNCVVCSPPDVIPFFFGDDSIGPHQDAARKRGIEPTILRLSGLGLDVDTPDDMLALMAEPVRSRAQAYLMESGINGRLKGATLTPVRPPASDNVATTG